MIRNMEVKETAVIKETEDIGTGYDMFMENRDEVLMLA